MRFHHFIFIGLGVGVLCGITLWFFKPEPVSGVVQADTFYETIIWWLDLIGKGLFIGSLKMIIAPLILASIIAGVTSIPNLKELGSIGWKTLAYYCVTTVIAVVIGLALVLVIKPGDKGHAEEIRNQRNTEIQLSGEKFTTKTGRDFESPENKTAFLNFLATEEGEKHSDSADKARWKKVASAKDRKPGDIFKDDIIRPILSNPFHSLSEMNSLGIIFFALLFGIACVVIGEPAKPVVQFFHSMNSVIMKITGWIMLMSPIAIAALMASIVASHGPGIFKSLIWYCGTVIGGIGIHIVVLLLICLFVGKIGPLRFLSGIKEAWATAFSTRSSAATLPITIKCATENLKVSPVIAEFSLPIGATVNMDGTALYEGVAIIFLMQLYGGMVDVPEISGMVTVLIFVTAVLASIGAAAVPDAGLVTMVLVATAVHMPIYYIPIIFAVDAFLDMFRTSTNVMGDCVGAVVIDRFERGKLPMKR